MRKAGGKTSPLVRALVDWYASRARALPWRETRDPYAIWISEIMLQQTRVDTVLPYYRRFLERFPSVTALAAAPLEAVLKAWENLGYYARARNLHRAARVVAERFAGRLPDRREDLLGLPGIGPYTAGAILSIAFGQPQPAVDGNVRRVISRLFALAEAIDEAPVQGRIDRLAAALVPAADPGSFTQALMELGALVCTPKGPRCADCPLTGHCLAFARDLTGSLPVRRQRRPVPHRQAVAAILRDEAGQLLLVQRPDRGLLASLWAFPGGLLGPGETAETGLQRILHETLGVEITVGPPLAAVDHAYTHFRVTLTAHAAALAPQSPAPAPDRRWRWLPTGGLDGLPLAKVDRLVARQLPPSR